MKEMNTKKILKAFGWLLLISFIVGIISPDQQETDDTISTAAAPAEVKSTTSAEVKPVETPTEEKPVVTPTEDQKKDDVSEDYKAKLREQEAKEKTKEDEKKEEETPIETSTHAKESTTTDSSLTKDDILWANTATSDVTTITTTLNSLTLAAKDTQEGIGSTISLSLYAGDLERETKTALSNSNKYTVSSELAEAQSEYNEALTDYNKAAKLVIQAMDAYNQGDTNTFSSLIGQSAEFLNSGTEHSNKVTALLNDYNQKHGSN